MLPVTAGRGVLSNNRAVGAIAVVLSGTASDGARGIQAVKREGGITFAQEGAEHSSMPSAAIATGCVDYVLPTSGIAAELLRIAAAGSSAPDGTTRSATVRSHG